MSSSLVEFFYYNSIIRLWPRLIAMVFFIVSIFVPARAQGFVSGSTGADGPFNPTTSQAIQLPPSGIFNFTTVNIPAGVTITFSPNANNTPVIILATGNVTINGGIVLNGTNGLLHAGGAGGPGGFRGGVGGFNIEGLRAGTNGDGPGGGRGGGGPNNPPNISVGGGGGGYALDGGSVSNASIANGGLGGPRYGTRTLIPLIGGSGGGGGNATTGGIGHGGSGGGGGGAILIASSGIISFGGGSIAANGGRGHSGSNGVGGAGGSGGAIRLVSNSISGTGGLDVSGNGSNGNGAGGSPGFIRIEAFDLSNFNLSVFPTISGSTGLPQSAILPNAPSLRIVSVAGIAAPSSPVGSLSGQPDIVLPSSQANPVTVDIQAANIPVGTLVDVIVTPDIGARTTFQSSPLTGTDTASTATASVDIPGNGLNVITATASIILTSSARPLFIDGERVNRVEIAAVYGGKSEVIYITQSGRRVKDNTQ